MYSHRLIHACCNIKPAHRTQTQVNKVKFAHARAYDTRVPWQASKEWTRAAMPAWEGTGCQGRRFLRNEGLSHTTEMTEVRAEGEGDLERTVEERDNEYQPVPVLRPAAASRCIASPTNLSLGSFLAGREAHGNHGRAAPQTCVAVCIGEAQSGGPEQPRRCATRICLPKTLP